MNDCAALLAKFGGHAAAAGGSIEPSRLPEFKEAFERAVAVRMNGPVKPGSIRVDLALSLAVAMSSIEELESLRPFGKDFPAPVILCPRLRIRSAAALGATGDHLKVQAHDEGSMRTAGLVLWRQGSRLGEFRPGRLIDVVGSPKRNSNPRYPDDFEVRDVRFLD
jgi:single-stranded-DNA-specific exonuclease